MSVNFRKVYKVTPKTPKYIEALKVLPENLVPVFDELLEHYKYAALNQHGRAIASPMVIAELVLLGWRNVEDAIPLLNSKNETK